MPSDASPVDPLSRAEAALASLDSLPLDRHPDAFADIDEQLRSALDGPVAAPRPARTD